MTRHSGKNVVQFGGIYVHINKYIFSIFNEQIICIFYESIQQDSRGIIKIQTLLKIILLFAADLSQDKILINSLVKKESAENKFYLR